MNHEALYVAVDQRVVIVSAGTQRKKVVCGLLDVFAVDFDLDVAQIRVQSDRHWRAEPVLLLA